MTRLFGVDDEFGEDAILGKLEGMKEVIEQVNKQFKDPVSLSIHFPFSTDCMVHFEILQVAVLICNTLE